ncbi:MAG: sensor histidine kinase, partial [Candidatus Helarchaeota archaeon]
QINIKVDTPNIPIFVMANELLIDIFDNLLNNAVKHNLNETIDIMIKISKEKVANQNFARLEFLDNGMGIKDDRKPIIFLRGFSDQKNVTGMGLGLSLVHHLVNLYNGKIWVEDRIPGDHSNGSNFILLLPEAN